MTSRRAAELRPRSCRDMSCQGRLAASCQLLGARQKPSQQPAERRPSARKLTRRRPTVVRERPSWKQRKRSKLGRRRARRSLHPRRVALVTMISQTCRRRLRPLRSNKFNAPLHTRRPLMQLRWAWRLWKKFAQSRRGWLWQRRRWWSSSRPRATEQRTRVRANRMHDSTRAAPVSLVVPPPQAIHSCRRWRASRCWKAALPPRRGGLM
mmetsp:Transcript_51274/g.115167  ORF Transcript_51274/g.115167 Transcript_51274/m.115167 type:complete len:209 (+) Transcript_51274:260-886(+)